MGIMETIRQKLFKLVGWLDHSTITLDDIIWAIQGTFKAEQWKDYIDELKNIMLEDMDSHMHIVKKLNTDQATCYFMLAGSASQKGEAILKSLGKFF